MSSRSAWRRHALRPRSFLLACLAALFASTAILSGASDSPWINATPEELSPAWKPLEADAPAEVLLWRVEVDDKHYPQDRRTTEYLRYKILVPAKAEEVMRISRIEYARNGIVLDRYDIRARLTQPSGVARELGGDAILSRPATKTRTDRTESGNFGTDIVRTEKYLAVSGAEPGAILEVQIIARETYAPQVTYEVLQRQDTPVRKLQYRFIAGNPTQYEHRFFLLNTSRAQTTEDPKTESYTVTAQDLPALVDEPYSGARSDYALTFFMNYTPYSMGAFMSGGGNYTEAIDPKAGPWAVFASVQRWIEEDRSAPTTKVKKAAAALVAGATSDLEKARRIHQRVQTVYQEFRHRAKSRESFTRRSATGPSLDYVLELGTEMHPDLQSRDFMYLALSLYRAAGLSAEVLLLPDREVARLDRKLPGHVFLSDWCLALRIGEQWHFSLPITTAPLPFDQLPWQNQGQGGLLARVNRQDFIDVPLDTADKSSITNFGVFRLDAEGTLTGEFRRIFTGQHAYALRRDLIDDDQEHQEATLKKSLDREFKGAELTVTKIAHVTEPDQPVEITYRVSWPGYAVLTEDRMIVRPSVFRAQSTPPFTATTRRNRVMLPFRWQETDRLVIELPPNYAPESMAMPPSLPGEVLNYRVAMSFEPNKRQIHLRREFQSAVITVPTDAYANLKKWYDAAANSDQHELVFIKSSAGESADAAKPQS